MINLSKEIKSFTKEFIKEIENHDSIIIFHHINPDGDCLGSQQGLKLWLEKRFPNKKIWAIGSNERLFNFLKWKFEKISDEKILENSLGIVVDANYSNRIVYSDYLKKMKTKIRIDHHPEEDDVDYKLRFVDSSFSSSCEQISLIIKTLDENGIDEKIAPYLYLGIYTDTGRFFYDYTSSRTHELVGWLMDTNFDFEFIHKNLAQRSMDEIKFNKEVLNNYKTYKNVIYYFLSYRKAKKLKLQESSRNRVDFLANIQGYNIWIFFIETKDKKIRVRLRSNDKNIQALAKEYGGGGHIKAAGAMISSPKQIKEVVEKASKL